MAKFMEAVADALRDLGFTQCDDGITSLDVGELSFYARRLRGGKSYNLLGVKYRLASDDYTTSSRDVKLAVHAIIEEIPKRMEEARKRARQNALCREAVQINRSLADSPFSVINFDGVFRLEFRHADRTTVMAAVDYLQEMGFADATPPLCRRDLQSLMEVWLRLSEEDRQAFLDEIKK